MSSTVVVLAVGKEKTLLKTRSTVLRSAGFVVVECLSPQHAIAVFYAGDFDCVILCHSVPREDALRLEGAMHFRSPGTPILYVQSFAGNEESCLIAVESEPQQLLETLSRLTAERSSIKENVRDTSLRSELRLRGGPECRKS